MRALLFKSVPFIKHRFLGLVVVLTVVMVAQKMEAAQFLSNLSNLYTTGGIGDIEGLYAGGAHYGDYTIPFTTGAGNFSVNTITLEFNFIATYPAGVSAPQWVNVQLFHTVGVNNTLIGSFGNPVSDPVPTQWPQSSHPNAYTTFIDFSPLAQINLSPFSQYSVVLSVPANSPVNYALLVFDTSTNYISTAGWTMSATTSGNPYAKGEFLAFAMDATPTPEPGIQSLFGLAILCFFWRNGLKRR